MHKYTPKTSDTWQLEGFSTLTYEEIYKTIIGMPSKSCELNILPTTFLKKVLKCCLPSIAKIVNLSLVTGEFCDKWKPAVVWQLIKALSKGTVKENYRPVSNLPFISKIVEKCTSSWIPISLQKIPQLWDKPSEISQLHIVGHRK